MLLKWIIAFTFCISTAECIVAQNTGSDVNAVATQHKVMIIPFNPYNYLSDADPELAGKNKKQPSEISTLFRYGLNYNISTRVITSDAYNILTDSTIASQKDLQMIYAAVHYEYQKPLNAFAKDSAEEKSLAQKDIFGNGGAPEEKKEDKSIAISFKKEPPIESTEQKRYLNAVVKNTDIFPALKEKYGTDLFLFINQFELITNYTHCLDRTQNFFERKVIVHYSIYNAAGKQLRGDAVEVTFSTSETNVDEIIGKNFPVIAEFLDQSIASSIQPAVQNK